MQHLKSAILILVFLIILTSCASGPQEKVYPEPPEIFTPTPIYTDKDLIDNYAGSMKFASHLILYIRLNIDPNYGLQEKKPEPEPEVIKINNRSSSIAKDLTAAAETVKDKVSAIVVGDN